MEKFKLFMCCLGNGITVCNKAVTENGDYKQIAHISEAGNIKLYVSENYIPADAMETIKLSAESQKESFKEIFESLSEPKQYEQILDSLPIGKLLEALKLNGTISEKLPGLRKYYYANA